MYEAAAVDEAIAVDAADDELNEINELKELNEMNETKPLPALTASATNTVDSSHAGASKLYMDELPSTSMDFTNLQYIEAIELTGRRYGDVRRKYMVIRGNQPDSKHLNAEGRLKYQTKCNIRWVTYLQEGRLYSMSPACGEVVILQQLADNHKSILSYIVEELSSLYVNEVAWIKLPECPPCTSEAVDISVQPNTICWVCVSLIQISNEIDMKRKPQKTFAEYYKTAIQLKEEGKLRYGKGKYSAALSSFNNSMHCIPHELMYKSNDQQKEMKKMLSREIVTYQIECLLKLRRYEDAVLHAKCCIQEFPKDGKLQYLYGRSLSLSNSLTDAITALKEAVNLDASNSAAKLELENVRQRKCDQLKSFSASLVYKPMFNSEKAKRVDVKESAVRKRQKRDARILEYGY